MPLGQQGHTQVLEGQNTAEVSVYPLLAHQIYFIMVLVISWRVESVVLNEAEW